MPQGQAFFTGNAKSTLAAKAAMPAITIPVGPSSSSTAAGSSSSGTSGIKSEAPRIARPNEVIDPTEETKVTMTSSSANAGYDSDDSDVSRDEEGKRRCDREAEAAEEAFLYEQQDGSALEVWPPQKYDSTAPLSLPFGPKTVALRRLLANAPILANPNDATALLNEESQSLFVVQLPSDLKMESLTRTVNTEDEPQLQSHPNNTQQQKQQEAPILGPDRKLGKLKLYKSGKVKLVTENGNSYDVSCLHCLAFS
jgi:hypothetical protein